MNRISYNTPIIVSPFGSLISDRSWTATGRNYRHGFNGKEKDFETANDDYDFGARIYDGRLARWLSLDPKAGHPLQVDKSPYAAFWNNPIVYTDPDGQFVIDPNATRAQRRAIKRAIREFKRFIENPVVKAAMLKYGQITYEQLKADAKNGQGPLLKIDPTLPAGVDGVFTPGIGSNEIRLNDDLLTLFENATGDTKDNLGFLLGVVLLHEETHKGDDQDGVGYPGEEGNLMENEVFGGMAGPGDVATYRAAYKKQEKEAKQKEKEAKKQKKKEKKEEDKAMEDLINQAVDIVKIENG